MNKADPNTTIGQVVTFIEERKPKQAYKFKLVLERVMPFIASLDEETRDATAEDLASLTDRIPASRLLECLTRDGKLWSPALIEHSPEFKQVKSLRSDYRRTFTHCIGHATASGIISTSAFGVSPEWQAARTALVEVLPTTMKQLDALLSQGATELFGHSLVEKAPKTTRTYFRTILDSTNEMARYLTTIGVASPMAVKPENLYGGEDAWYSHYRRLWSDRGTAVSRSRYGWNILRQLKPEWQLVEWPRPLEDWSYALPESELPHMVRSLFRILFKGMELSENTQTNILVNLKRYLGFIKRELNVDLDAMCADLDCEEDLMWLLLGGMPLARDGREPATLDEIARLSSETEYRQEILLIQPRANRRHEAQGVCRSNPFLQQYVDWMLSRGIMGAAEVALKMFRIVANRYLRVHASQIAWLKGLQERVTAAKKLSPPSARMKRKQTAALDPDLWPKLVDARPRMRIHTDEMRSKWVAANEGSSKDYWAQRYAVAVRNELITGILLAFPLRSKNILQMKIGVDIFPERYRIDVPGFRTKATNRIVREFPDAGPFEDLKELLDMYLEEARPILLKGRGETPYFFLASAKGDEVRDSEGNLTVSRRRLRDVVQDAIKRHFSDLLPPELDLFSPHTYRDIYAKYAYETSGGEALAAEGLANSPTTVRKHYLVMNQGDGSRVKKYLEKLSTVRVASHRPKSRKEAMQDISRLIKHHMKQDASPQLVRELLKAIGSTK